MKQVRHDNATETRVHRFAAEASTLGLPPGHWPTRLTTDLGNGQDLVRVHVAMNGDDVAFCRYAQLLGCIDVNVYND